MATESFEDLGLDPALVEVLGAEGIERPTAFQIQALPLIRRGNNVIGRAGPGAGTLVGYGASLLDRLGRVDEEEDEEVVEDPTDGPRALILTPSASIAGRLAASLARLAQVTDLRVAALGGPWVLPDRADILFAPADDALARVQEGRLNLKGLEAVVVEQLTALLTVAGKQSLETLFDFLPAECQRVVLELPSRDGDAAVEEFAARHLKRGVHVPPRSVDERPPSGSPDRGEVRYRIVNDPLEGGVLLVSELLYEPEVRHLMIFFRSDDRAADVGDNLTLHGYLAGAPGDTGVPVWLAVDELEARAVLDEAEEGVTLLSWDVPADPDSLDRRHGGGRGGHVLCLPREMPHLRDTARRTGYRVKPNPPPVEERIHDDLVRTVESVEKALEEEDVGAYLLVLESLFESHDPAEVAAAAVALLRKKRSERSHDTSGAAATVPSSGTPAGARGPAWVRLFITLGTKDDARPGDVVGAITGEAGVDGSKVGKIELRDSFSIVEVEESVAERVIGALNGTTVRGRSLRVDYDRASRRPSGGGRPGGRRGGGDSGAGGGDRRRSSGGPAGSSTG